MTFLASISKELYPLQTKSEGYLKQVFNDDRLQ